VGSARLLGLLDLLSGLRKLGLRLLEHLALSLKLGLRLHEGRVSQRELRQRPVDGVYAYQTSFGLANRQVLCRGQRTLLPSSVNPRYRIHGTNV
jgi:hypothetical protein